MDKLSFIFVKRELLKRKILIFTVKDFIRIFNVQPKTARSFLSFNAGRGNIRRVKRGSYMFYDDQLGKFEIANYLYKPSYVSFETALSYYGIIPEMVYAIISATTNRNAKEVDLDGQNYQYRQIKKTLFFGYEPIKIKNRLVLMADKEKALLDYLYLLSLKHNQINERIDLTKIDKKKLDKYVNYFKKFVRKNRALINLLKSINL